MARHSARPSPFDTGENPAVVAILAPPPVMPEAVTLTNLLPEAAQPAVDRFLSNWLPSSLAPWRNDIPITVPDISILRPLIWGCQSGNDGQWYGSPAWSQFFGLKHEQAQGYLRATWQAIKAHRKPDPEQYDQLVTLLASAIIDVFKQAAERQQERLDREAVECGPVAVAQVAAALVETLAPFRQAFDAYRRLRGSGAWAELRGDLDKLARAAAVDLS